MQKVQGLILAAVMVLPGALAAFSRPQAAPKAGEKKKKECCASSCCCEKAEAKCCAAKHDKK